MSNDNIAGDGSINYMDIEEFADEGYLQEVNRLVLHTVGLALSRRGGWTREMINEWVAEKQADHPESIGLIDPAAFVWAFAQENGLDKWHLNGVWDYRDDSEGIIYGEIDPHKRDNVRRVQAEHYAPRNSVLGEESGVEHYPGRVQHVGETVSGD